jgi:putative transposase
MRPPRLTGFAYVGCHRYFLTICTFQKIEHFRSADVVNAVLLQFLRTSNANGFAVPAYCFMPDHLHVLAEGKSDSADLRGFVSDAKQHAAHDARRWICGRLWQPGYYDRVLREDDNSYEVARYIVLNPVRAGLVASPGDYPFLGSDLISVNDLIASTHWKP